MNSLMGALFLAVVLSCSSHGMIMACCTCASLTYWPWPDPALRSCYVYNAGGNPDSNTLISDMTTVICLDDYHCLDRKGRAEKKVTALAPAAQNFDLMAQQVKALKDGKSVDKPIYNHVTGMLDAPEKVESPKVRACICSTVAWRNLCSLCHEHVSIVLIVASGRAACIHACL